MRKVSKQKLLGHIGEYYCEKALSETMDSYTRADKFNFIGSSYLLKNCHQDFDYIDRLPVIRRCQSSGYCEFKNKERPCLTEDFFEINYEALDGLDLPDTGDNKFRWYCALRHTKIEIDDYEWNTGQGSEKFVRDHLLCQTYIENLYHKYCKENDYNKMSQEEKKAHHKYWSGHPGRLDFFAKKGKQFYAIDSKVNTSKLSLWQQVRLSWLQKCGYSSQIYNILIDTNNIEKLTRIYLEEGVETATLAANPSLNILSYDPKMSPQAELLTSNIREVIEIAKVDYKWFTPPGKFTW